MGKENLKITFVDVNSLKVAAYNPRKWDDAKKEKLKESIERFGLVDPIIVNSAPERKNIVIGGHFRLAVAKELKIQEGKLTDIPGREFYFVPQNYDFQEFRSERFFEFKRLK